MTTTVHNSRLEALPTVARRQEGEWRRSSMKANRQFGYRQRLRFDFEAQPWKIEDDELVKLMIRDHNLRQAAKPDVIEVLPNVEQVSKTVSKEFVYIPSLYKKGAVLSAIFAIFSILSWLLFAFPIVNPFASIMILLMSPLSYLMGKAAST